jgi:hypothetical protein
MRSDNLGCIREAHIWASPDGLTQTERSLSRPRLAMARERFSSLKGHEIVSGGHR